LGSGGIPPPFLTSAIYRIKLSASHICLSTPEGKLTMLIGEGCECSRAGLCGFKILKEKVAADVKENSQRQSMQN
jgi:hypothetical protein